jgi:hypothetical protein
VPVLLSALWWTELFCWQFSFAADEVVGISDDVVVELERADVA